MDPSESTLESAGAAARAAEICPPRSSATSWAIRAWQAELAWPDRRIAIVLTGPSDDPETEDRDRAYAEAGWHARTAREWSAEELAAQIEATSGGERR